ncbi:MAG TPA: ThuA domain-containing protein [Chthoniobacteraceae bacterium]|nr:ThuA domain-containing protein [Chthoniobacteraceae bacterium]
MTSAIPIRHPVPASSRRLLRAILILIYAAIAGSLTSAVDPPLTSAAVTAAPLKMHVISGSKEYLSEASLKPFLAALENDYHVAVSASWGTDGGSNLENLGALENADVLLIFTRRMKLPEEQMKPIRAHWEAGRPIVGIRTASHAFQQPDNEVFDRKILGGSHQSHWADEPVKVTNQPDQAGHPVLRGVGPFVSRKLYKRGDLLNDVTILQTGDNGKDTQPVTVTRVHHGGRIVYTSLGVPEDFKDNNFRRLLINALFWTTHRDPERMRK